MLPSDIVTRNIPPISPAERKVSRLVLLIENLIKVPLFGCQRCGECILSSTGFICSQRCPKQLRNGPCGGTDANGACEIDPNVKCVWYRIYYRSRWLNRISLLYKFNKIHNWSLKHTSSWLNVFYKRTDPPVLRTPNKPKAKNEQGSNDAQG